MKNEILEWLNGQIAEAEKAVRAREQMEEGWKDGDEKTWAKIYAMNPKGPRYSVAERLKLSESQGRIAAKCRRDLAMLRTIHGIVEQTTFA